MSETLYVYGFVPAGTPAPDRLTGIAGRPVEALALDGFGAAVSRVPGDVYAPGEVEARLGDLDWVAEQGLAHERVVAWFVDHAQILPVRLLTLYSGEAALRDEAGPRAERIAGELDRLRGLREWDLKVSYDRERLSGHAAQVSEEVASLDSQIEAAAPGRRYLLERKRADVVSAEVARAARRIAGELLQDATSGAEAHRTLPLPREAGSLPVVLNAALLVRQESEAGLSERVGRRAGELAELGIDVRFSGPWAPYRFVEEDQGVA